MASSIGRFLVICLLLAGCAATEQTDEISQTQGVATTQRLEASIATTTSTTTTTTTAVVEPAEPSTGGTISVSERPSRLEPGTWTIDLDMFHVDFESDEMMKVDAMSPGELLVSATSTPTSYEGFGVFELKSLMTTTAQGVLLDRLPPAEDLSAWLTTLEGVTIAAQGETEIAGTSANWWRFDDERVCTGCFRAMFSAGHGSGAGVFGSTPGFTFQIWTIGLDDRVVAIGVEAPTDSFDSFLARMQPMLDSLSVHIVPDRSTWRSADALFPAGRMEMTVSDETRSTPKVASTGSAGTDVENRRDLLVSLLYPSATGGWDAPPADGRFPLVILAPALGDHGATGALELRLAQHGYVVARIRHPASSWPGQVRKDIDEQPADISLVLDALLGDGLPTPLVDTVDPERIGAVGLSMGGTTIYGLLGAPCCLDDRIDAAVSHAPTTYDFGEDLVFSDAPLLIITSASDPFAPPEKVAEMQGLSPSTISSFVLPPADHLTWLDERSPHHEAIVDLTRGFLDKHVVGADNDVSSAADGLDGEWRPAQTG